MIAGYNQPLPSDFYLRMFRRSLQLCSGATRGIIGTSDPVAAGNDPELPESVTYFPAF